MGGVAELLSGSWVTSGEVLGGLGEVLGVMLARKMAAKSRIYLTKRGSKRQAVRPRFFMDSVWKISSWGDPKVCI